MLRDKNSKQNRYLLIIFFLCSYKVEYFQILTKCLTIFINIFSRLMYSLWEVSLLIFSSSCLTLTLSIALRKSFTMLVTYITAIERKNQDASEENECLRTLQPNCFNAFVEHCSQVQHNFHFFYCSNPHMNDRLPSKIAMPLFQSPVKLNWRFGLLESFRNSTKISFYILASLRRGNLFYRYLNDHVLH